MRKPKHTNVVDNRKLDIQKFCLALSRIHNNVIVVNFECRNLDETILF
jgi:hypothetical protein